MDLDETIYPPTLQHGHGKSRICRWCISWKNEYSLLCHRCKWNCHFSSIAREVWKIIWMDETSNISRPKMVLLKKMFLSLRSGYVRGFDGGFVLFTQIDLNWVGQFHNGSWFNKAFVRENDGCFWGRLTLVVIRNGSEKFEVESWSLPGVILGPLYMAENIWVFLGL